MTYTSHSEDVTLICPSKDLIPSLSVSQACPLWSCLDYNRKNLFLFCALTEVV